MSHITVLGGTGYAGSAIVAEAASRGHQLTSFSRSLPDGRIPNVTYVQGDATDETALSSVIKGADVVVGALAPRGGARRPVPRGLPHHRASGAAVVHAAQQIAAPRTTPTA